MQQRISQILILLLGLALLALAACSPSGQGPRGEDNALAEIKKIHEVKIAVHPYNIPFEFGKDTGIQGIGADVGEAIVKDLQAKVDPQVRANWLKADSFDPQVFNLIDKGEAQMAISSISVTEERKKKGYLFSQPYYPDSGQIIATRTSEKGIKKVGDLAGKKVGVQENTTGQKFLESQNLPGVQISKYRTLDDALLKLSSGELDAVVGDKPIVSYIIFQTYKNQLTTVGDLLTHEPYAVMTKSPELLKIINETIARLDQEGKLKEIAKARFEDYELWQKKLAHDLAKKREAAESPKTLTFQFNISSFPADRLDGHQLRVQGTGGSFTSSHIVTSGRSGRCSVGGVPPGTYQVSLNLIRWHQTITVPADDRKSIAYTYNF